MAEFTVKTGTDGYVLETIPAANFAGKAYPRVRAGDEYRTFLHMPLSAAQVRGKTILSATLSGVARASWVSQTLTVQAVSASWNAASLTWSNKPATTGPTATEATGVLGNGDRFEVDVTALVQQIADGTVGNYGWQITTSQSTDISTLYGFASGQSAWVLTVEVSDVIPRPSQLSPEGVIGTDLPVLLFDDVDDLAQVQVQIDATPSGTNADYDTGWVAVTTPQLDMSDTFSAGTAAGVGDTTYNGLADGATTNWRVRVKTVNGSTSPWSEWVEITHEAKPVIVMDNPSGTDLWDPTPTIAAHLSPAGDADTRWRVLITDADDTSRVRYDSGDAIEGATLDLDIPLRYRRRKVFPTDGDYRIEVRAWDRTDRVPSRGVPGFVREVVTVTLDVDGTQTAPTDLVVSQAATGYPDVTIGWERASDPDYFVVRRDGEFILRLTPDECRVSPGVFEWPDETAQPNVTHQYTVRAVTDVGGGVRKQSDNSNVESITTVVKGVWLRSDFGDVELFGTSIDARQVDKRQTFELPYRSENVDIVTSEGGFVGSFTGVVDQRCADLDDARDQLDDLRTNPTAEVRMVWGTENRWVHLRGVSVSPDPEWTVTNPVYRVDFEFFEIDPRD